MDSNSEEDYEVLLIEPFYGGSHKVLIDTLIKNFQEKGIKYFLITLPSKKWHWRARCGALQVYDKIPETTCGKILWTSSVLNLAELLGLCPNLIPMKKIVYFHENQLIYPVQQLKSRDIQYSYNQVTTCLAADIVLFNSLFNKQSFLENIPKILKLIPDHRPKSIKTSITQKCRVLYFPVSFPLLLPKSTSMSVLHIVWPHRWEFDKGPCEFFDLIFRLKKDKLPFRLSVLGEMYHEVPDVFKKAKNLLEEEIVHFGFIHDKENYYNILSSSHVAISTAKHEFFGISMMEAAYCGCFPLVPNGLVYPEIFPEKCRYSNTEDLFKCMKELCLNPNMAVELRHSLDIKFDNYSDQTLIPKYLQVLGV